MTRHPERTAEYIENALARISQPNRDTVRRYVAVRRLHGLKPSSLYNYTLVLLNLDHVTQGRPYRELTSDDVLNFLTDFSGRCKNGSLITYMRLLKRFLLDHHDGELPQGMDHLLTARDPTPPDNANIITDQDVVLMLDACHQERRSRIFHKVEHNQALLLTLWDSGFRISELLSLKWRNVAFEKGGSVTLTLDPQHANLKSGARSVNILECTAALKAWGSLHPCPQPDRYVFITDQSDGGSKIARVNTINDLLVRLASHVGLYQHSAKGLTCHDFRHSSATRRAHWGEAALRLFHGWKRDSDMPARYVHKDMESLRLQVRQDTGLNASGLAHVTQADMKTCPICAEDIKAAALKCRYCGEVLKQLR